MIDVQPATQQRWDDLVTVMGVRGDPSWCWCQYFHLRGQGWKGAAAGSNKERLEQQTRRAAQGVLAYDDGQPVGWCAVAPRANYDRLAHSAVSTSTEDADGLWAVTCFVVRVGFRKRGVALALLEGAIAHAKAGGATEIEAYPVDLNARKASSAELFHGPLSIFERAGFTEVTRPVLGRPVVRLRVR